MKNNTLLILLLLCSQFCQAQVMHGKQDYKKVLNFRGRYFKFSRPMTMNIMGTNRTSTPNPISVNGEQIYRSTYEVETNPIITKYQSFSDYIMKALKPHLAKLPDGNYMTDGYTFVVGKDGRLIYFDYRDIIKVTGERKKISGANLSETEMRVMLATKAKPKPSRNSDTVIAPKIAKEINDALYRALANAPAFKPAVKGGKSVHCLLEPGYDFHFYITVKNGVVDIEQTNLPIGKPKAPKTGRA